MLRLANARLATRVGLAGGAAGLGLWLWQRRELAGPGGATGASASRAVEPQTVHLGAEPCAVSWTGGKDCNLALLHAWRDPSLRVTALVVFRPEAAQFKAHPLSLMQAQADALGLPLRHVLIPRDTSSYKEAYVTGMRRLREAHDIRVMATGDMDLVGSMPRNWIAECGEEAGIRAYLPLWQAERVACLRTLLAEGFHIVFSCVKAPWLDATWVGRRLDEEALNDMSDLAQHPPAGDPTRLPLDMGGENGEYHTMVLDGPLYTRPVTVDWDPADELTAQKGMKPNERWWTVRVRTCA